MVNSNPGFDTLLQAIVNNVVIMVNAGLVNCANPVWENARPGNGEPEVGYIELFYKINVLFVIIVKIAGSLVVIAI